MKNDIEKAADSFAKQATKDFLKTSVLPPIIILLFFVVIFIIAIII